MWLADLFPLHRLRRRRQRSGRVIEGRRRRRVRAHNRARHLRESGRAFSEVFVSEELRNSVYIGVRHSEPRSRGMPQIGHGDAHEGLFATGQT